MAGPSPTSPSASRTSAAATIPAGLQTSPTLGIVLSLMVIIAARTYFGGDAFNNWASRIPFVRKTLQLLIQRRTYCFTLISDVMAKPAPKATSHYMPAKCRETHVSQQ
jgi:hypothetical protein